MQYNTNTRNELAAAFGALFNAGTLVILTATDEVLGIINLSNTAFGPPSMGQISKSGIWSGTASASGVPAKGVFISADTNKQAIETCGTAGSGAALIISASPVIQGGSLVVDSYTYTVPAS